MQYRIRIRAIAFLFTALVLLAALVLPACKKGEDDPFISLASRKKRIEGTWKLKRCIVRGLYINRAEGDFDYVMTSENSTFHYDFIGDTVAEPYSGNFTLVLEFDKDGIFSFTENFNFDTYKASGGWDFLRGTGEAK